MRGIDWSVPEDRQSKLDLGSVQAVLSPGLVYYMERERLFRRK